MFDDFEELDNNAAKGKLAQKLCIALKVHTQIEGGNILSRAQGSLWHRLARPVI